jgi:hypothetical protein
MVSEVQTPKEVALAHYRFGMVLLNEGIDKHKEGGLQPLPRGDDQGPGLPISRTRSLPTDRRWLISTRTMLRKRAFEEYVKMEPAESPERQRALRFIEDPGLARARLAPPLKVTTVGFTGPPVAFAPYLDELGDRLSHQYLLTFLAKRQKKAGWQRVRLMSEIPKVDLVAPKRVWVSP